MFFFVEKALKHNLDLQIGILILQFESVRGTCDLSFLEKSWKKLFIPALFYFTSFFVFQYETDCKWSSQWASSRKI